MLYTAIDTHQRSQMIFILDEVRTGKVILLAFHLVNIQLSKDFFVTLIIPSTMFLVLFPLPVSQASSAPT